ncbi:TonB-dependent receptor domain-containing protein [Dyadobacter bucti]|uniref:TonB-dependent receptor domain-containing protein n=1 Tax=Dyadobacter bucti TaxID=2572203 RepID=UPI003F6F6653
MKKLLFILSLFLGIQNSQAQVSGRLVTNAGAPVPFANVLLRDTRDSANLAGAATTETGEFRIENTRSGHYMLRLSSLGYVTRELPAFELTSVQNRKDFGDIILEEEAGQLQEVYVRAAKPMFQQEIDRTVINVESNVLSKGSSALEILQRSPGVIIDERTNGIALNGKNGVMVMINGKMMRIPVEQLLAMLNGMSANDIEKIELITTPPAGYDADGSGGLINIVMKKDKKPGTNGSLSLTAGHGWGEKATGSGTIGHHTGKIDLYGSYTFSRDRSRSNFSAHGSEIAAIVGGPATFEFRNVYKPLRNNHNLSGGIDAQLSPKITVGGNIGYINSRTSSQVFNQAEYILYPDSLLLFNGHVDGNSRWRNTITSVYAEKKIREGEKITFNADYLHYNIANNTIVNSSFLDENGNQAGSGGENQFAADQSGFARTAIRVGVVKLDYAKQLSKKTKVETGVKTTYTESSSLSGIQELINGEWKPRDEVANDLAVTEGIGAAYLSFHTQFNPSTSLAAGVRYEYARTQIADGRTGENSVDRRLGKFFPSLFFSKKLNEKNELQLSYSKRISRPSYNDLSSFVSYNDPISYFTGNPLLKPTITNNLKAGYHFYGYSVSVLFSRDDYPIVQGQITPGGNGDLVYISPQNIRYQNNLTFETSIPVKVTGWWSMNYGFVGGWRQYKLDYLANWFVKSFLSYSANFSQSFRFAGNFSAELSGWYNSASYGGNARVSGFGAVNAGIKKELKKNKGSVQFSVTDMLRTMNIRNSIGVLTEDAFHTRAYVSYNAESRRFPIMKLTFSRSFGGTRTERRQENSSSEERDRVR